MKFSKTIMLPRITTFKNKNLRSFWEIFFKVLGQRETQNHLFPSPFSPHELKH
jgi:hypothetical protein